VSHYAAPDFWKCYRALSPEIRDLADRAYNVLKDNPRHPSLRLKQIDRFWSVRVGLHYRALGIDVEAGILWFWIGSHADYDALLEKAR
jgi:hypothetical protein